jgi:hypothetical protein
MLRRTEPVVLLVPRFERRVQSKRAAAPTWTRRFVIRSVDAAMASSRSVLRVIAATLIAREPVVRPRAGTRSAPLVRVIGAVPKAALIIVTTSARIARA